ncbi:Uncharacterised protein [Mycobacterium tuberculosis]|uniref:Uncharacterized protein n=1 Tax=Mycobacterium tuberculosis TaxID=1773 RepID=A0A655E9E8_MYCTX|nr:Uncharacterised protein [Mycobacterium tuberculosis]CNV11219.1 Uncharacterised protein [Mycobacterium tuberculosis]CNV16834.1 Uncharacterised protein [Mycobacterium tuberculosis]COW21543.1 Uncharacterised protein [Mycobacterium tuberculosis]
MVVKTPSSRMPDNSHRPLTPAPVPTSATALPPLSLASKHSNAPTAGVTAPAPMSVARSRAPARITSSDIDPSACAQSDSPRLGAGWPGMSSCPGVPSMPAAYVQLATPSGRRAWFERRPSTELDACGCTRHARRAGRDEGHFDSIFPGQRR